MNDIELKKALAEMLPDKTYLYFNPQFAEPTLFWGKRGDMNPERVKDTEFLHLCWLVEETVKDNGLWGGYVNRLWDIVCPEYFQMGGLNAGIALLLIHATWQQRTIALCKVKNILIE